MKLQMGILPDFLPLMMWEKVLLDFSIIWFSISGNLVLFSCSKIMWLPSVIVSLPERVSWPGIISLRHAKRYSAIDGSKKGSDCKDQFDRANYWWIK